MKKGILMALTSASIFLMSFQLIGWVAYQPKDGHFAAKFPGTPTENANEQKTGNGTPYSIHVAYYSVSQQETYAVSWVNIHNIYPAKKTTEELLLLAKDGACKGIKATSAKVLATQKGKYPYIDFTFVAENIAGHARIYIINDMQYSLLTTYASEKDVTADAERFINSFHYTK